MPASKAASRHLAASLLLTEREKAQPKPSRVVRRPVGKMRCMLLLSPYGGKIFQVPGEPYRERCQGVSRIRKARRGEDRRTANICVTCAKDPEIGIDDA